MAGPWKGSVLTVYQGASVKEILIEACRRNNTDLLTETLAGRPDAEITKLLNETTTVMGNHLYHEAASRGNCESPTPLKKLVSFYRRARRDLTQLPTRRRDHRPPPRPARL